jgi:hypothetical protein
MKTREELSYCGCDCEECDIYRAMHYGQELKPEIIQSWQELAGELWGIDALDPKQLNCRGCRYEGEDVFYGFRLCPARTCCKERGFSSCGLCPEFKICKYLEPGGRENLEIIAHTMKKVVPES